MGKFRELFTELSTRITSRRFWTIASENKNGFPLNLLCALILEWSALVMIMGKNRVNCHGYDRRGIIVLRICFFFCF